MTNKQVLEAFEQDFKISKEQKSQVNTDITKWNDIYEGKPYGNETANHSKFVWKIVQKQGETLVSNLAKPFISGDQNIMITPVTDKDVYKAKIDQGILNHYHDKYLDKNRFYKDMARVMTKEGTAWIRVGWKKINKRKSIKIGQMNTEQIQQVQEQGFEVVNKNGVFYIEKDNIVQNQPTADVLKNGRCYTDPLANKSKDMRFMIYEYEISIGELNEQKHLYDEKALKMVNADYEYLVADYFEDLESGTESAANGSTNYYDKGRKKLKLYEYWVDLDIDDDGVPVPCVAVMSNLSTGRAVMSLKKNPYAFKKIPFIGVPLVPDLYSVWGKPIAPLIEDIQYIYTMLMRGVIDNTSSSNNSIKFVKKGALDAENHRRLMAKEPLVEVNTTENINTAVMDGGYNQIPASIFNLFAMLDQEAEGMTGISKIMQGVTGAHMNASATNFTATLSMSQVRLLDITQNINYAMKEMLEMWMSMALDYLSEDEIETITGINIDKLKVQETQILMQEYGIDQLPADVAQKAQMIIMEEVNDLFSKEDLNYDIRIKVGTDGVKEIRINQLNMLMQQIGGLSGMVDPMILKDLLAEYAELMDFPVTAEKIREYVPQPDPTAEQAKQLELAKMGAEAEKEAALGDNARARAEQVRSETAGKGMGLEADVAAKYAGVAKTYSDIDNEARDRDVAEFSAGAKAGNDSRKVDNEQNRTNT